MALQAQLRALSLHDVEETGKELGRGAYGSVYEVRVSGLVCAGKTLHEAIIQNETLDKFVEECLCHSQQHHPNIVQLLGVHFFCHSRLPMLVMEYLPLSLTQCLETHQDLPLQIKYSILLDVAKGLNYLHCKRPPIVHRDLTANNILLTSNFIAKISDLGVSRLAVTFKRQQLTKAPGNAIVMPPEALKGNPGYDHKLDVFSYGCLILHVFTHQWPAPTAQYVRKQYDPNSFSLVSEWDRRANYTTVISGDNPFFLFTKSCLCNDPKKRPTISDAIICAEHAVSSLPPMKNKIEMIKEIDSLTKQVDQLEKQVHDVIEKSKQATNHAQEDLMKLVTEKDQLMTSLSAKQKEIDEIQTHQSIEHQKKLTEIASLREKESVEFQRQLDDYEEVIRKKEEENGDLQKQLNTLLSEATKQGHCLSKIKSLITTEQSPVNSYVGQVVYEEKGQNEWVMIFLVAQHYDDLIKYICSSHPKAERSTNIAFKFQEENGYIELAVGEGECYHPRGWSFFPHSTPTRISQVDVDKFGAYIPPHFPASFVTISVTPSDTTVQTIHYSITLKGIELTGITEGEPIIPKICIVRSIALSGRQSVQGPDIIIKNLESQEKLQPAEIFRSQMADLIEAIESSVDRVTDRLFSERLINKDVLKSTAVVGVSNYQNARKLVHVLYSQLQDQSYPEQCFIKICDVMLKQDDRRLKDIASKMKLRLY